MKPLTKDNFMVEHLAESITMIECNPKIRDQILKNQEDAEKIDDMYIKLGQYKQIVEVVKRHKDTILGCMKQSDANWVYDDADKAIEELEDVLGENHE